MDLARRFAMLFAAVALGLAIGWWIGHTGPQTRIDDLGSQLQDRLGQLEEARQRWRLTESDLDDQVAEKQKWKAKTKDLRPRLEALRHRTGQLRGLKQAFSPHRGTLASARLVAGSAHDLLAVTWRVEKYGPQFASRSGLEIWRLSDRSSLDLRGSIATKWELVYSIQPRPALDENPVNSYLLSGPLGQQTREESFSTSVFIADVGDITHDGMPDLAIQDSGSGSGGCGAVRVLDNSASGMREIFHRSNCDHHIYIKTGSIGYRTAYSPPGCSSAHGCGWKRTWMRWNGSSWDVTNVRRKLY